ncbi:ACC2, partial [Symbiodinium sp. CCMP2456]
TQGLAGRGGAVRAGCHHWRGPEEHTGRHRRGEFAGKRSHRWRNQPGIPGDLYPLLHHGAFRGYRCLPEPPGSAEHSDGQQSHDPHGLCGLEQALGQERLLLP